MESSATAKWAQDKNTVFLVIGAKNIARESIKIDLTDEGKFNFLGSDRLTGSQCSLKVDLFDEVVIEESKWKSTDFCIEICFSKKNKEARFWPRLTKINRKFAFISVDWSRWVDEDEEKGRKNHLMGYEEDLDESGNKISDAQIKLPEEGVDDNACGLPALIPTINNYFCLR